MLTMSSPIRSLVLAIAIATGLWAGDGGRLYKADVISLGVYVVSATSINSSGQVAGYVQWYSQPGPPPFIYAFLYTNGSFSELPPGIATAAGINDGGQIVGQIKNDGSQRGPSPQAYLYSNGVVTNLGLLPGKTQSWAAAINNGGQVVGYSATDSGDAEAFLYNGGVMTGLGFLPGGNRSWATAINRNGQIVGYSINASGNKEAFSYSGGIMTGLGTLPGYAESVATGVNDSGQIVGYASNAQGKQAFLYANGVMTGLGFVPGATDSTASGINNSGQIVGSDSRGSFLYSGGQMHDLNAVSPARLAAIAINDRGQILGQSVLLTPMQGRFVPVTPCRIVDTRFGSYPFGLPALAASATRDFPILDSQCGISATAQAYSLNVTVMPHGPLAYLTIWPAGMDQPFVSTLNSFDGSVTSNAAIVPAGQNGAVSVYVTGDTDLILDINGYFDTTGDSFYTLLPCRIADTRNPAGPLGGPQLGFAETRDFPVLSSACGLPPTATAYSMNVTVVPPAYLGYLAIWPTGQPQPNVSTLNSWNGTVVANAAIVPAGTNGSASVHVTNATDVVLDTNGYFAPSGQPGALTFYPVAPCRIADTREADGDFGGPIIAKGTTRTFTIPDSDCSIPANAAAYSLNITALPNGPLPFLTAWPAGSPRPGVSTLNSWDGRTVANAAIVPAGTDGAINVYADSAAHVILDINGYFAP